MEIISVGRTLDEQGEPVPGSGFEVDPEGIVAETLAERTGPLISNPVSQEWVADLEPPENTGGEYHSAIYLSAGEGPPEHYHVGYEETFEVLSGELTVVVEGTPHRVSAGESHTVPAGTVHKPRYDGDTFAAAIGTVRPPGKTLQLIKTLFGLAHEGKLDDSGQPGFLQGMVLTKELADDSVFVSPPPTVTRPLATALAPVGRGLGYQTTYSTYEDPEFWEQHVEQPPF
ncbi:cupin domain-containing protein [Natrinema sp. 1APR25-10V2]|uniref:cupin domain-containing protein n=1 Tax=Natrinema sp. 1APR25-10V2 TaxID=2951081 RepID=UPI00287632A8|nr:cupin domain-containing protein [Natrinema sp. 1APR25-10V2]MDS0474552.1 cupin domain-containing protein [Natrinema sp. 1APR25-10V2]